jgi:protein-S-isoprenylcysteine O-methyltransferase Ste14
MNSSDNSGVRVPPPLYYVITLLAGIALRRFLPFPFFAERETTIASSCLVAAGLLLAVWGASTMLRARTGIDPTKPTTTIVRRGPFRFSRNPLYLALAIVYAGLSIYFRSLPALLLLPVAMTLMYYAVIRYEERYLEGKFGDEYCDYRKSVRRWV